MKTRLEPIAYFYQRDFDKYAKQYPDGIPVVTVERAEEYTIEMVNAALEEAAKVPRRYAEQLDKGPYGVRYPDETTAIFNASTNMANWIEGLKIKDSK